MVNSVLSTVTIPEIGFVDSLGIECVPSLGLGCVPSSMVSFVVTSRGGFVFTSDVCFAVFDSLVLTAKGMPVASAVVPAKLYFKWCPRAVHGVAKSTAEFSLKVEVAVELRVPNFSPDMAVVEAVVSVVVEINVVAAALVSKLFSFPVESVAPSVLKWSTEVLSEGVEPFDVASLTNSLNTTESVESDVVSCTIVCSSGRNSLLAE